jgi:hypothetical protein
MRSVAVAAQPGGGGTDCAARQRRREWRCRQRRVKRLIVYETINTFPTTVPAEFRPLLRRRSGRTLSASALYHEQG